MPTQFKTRNKRKNSRKKNLYLQLGHRNLLVLMGHISVCAREEGGGESSEISSVFIEKTTEEKRNFGSITDSGQR